MKDYPNTPCHRPQRPSLEVGKINYTAEQINALLELIPLKVGREDLNQLINFTSDNFIGHYPDASMLTDQKSFAWAFVGDLAAAVPYFHYMEGYAPKGYAPGWNNMQHIFGTYPLFTDNREDQLTAEELFKIPFRLPELTADRAIADEHGNRIPDTYVTRQGLTEHIKETYNQQFLENPPLITEGYITPQMLSEETRQMLEATGQKITNLPDGEDLNTVHGVLKLANKQYNPGAYSGLGRQYLRKNIVAGVNILTQSMMQWPNTIYIIQYDYDLQGETITVPEGCVLDFQGGSLNNGDIVFNNTKLSGTPKIYCKYNNSIKGDINVLWFGVDNEGINGVSDALQTIVNIFNNKTIYFPTGIYIIDKQIKLPKSISFAGNGDDSILELRHNGYNFLLDNYNNEGNYAVTIKMRNLKIEGTYPSWYDLDADNKKTECSFLHVKATAYTYYSLFEDININNVKFGITIDKCYWSRFSKVRFYNYETGLDLGEANSSNINGCTFRGGFDRGLILRRSYNEPSAGIGVCIHGNDFSGNNYCGMQILGQVISASIIGNYFESEPGYQIVVGGKDAEKYNTPIALTSSIIKGNGGLWAEGKKGIKVYADFSNNDCDAAVYFEEGSSGLQNIGCNEISTSKIHYNEMWTYGTKYRNGILDYWDSQIKHDIIENICIPANSEIIIDSFPFRYFKFLYFRSLTSGITLSIYIPGDTKQYIVGSEEQGQGSMEDEIPFWNGDLLDIGRLDNCIIKLKNTTDKNVVTNIEVKYFCNLYGK